MEHVVISRSLRFEAKRAKARGLDALVREDPVRPRLEIMKHLEGDLEIRPLA